MTKNKEIKVITRGNQYGYSVELYVGYKIVKAKCVCSAYDLQLVVAQMNQIATQLKSLVK